MDYLFNVFWNRSAMLGKSYEYVKVGLSPSNFFFNCFNKSSFKLMKNYFYFMLKVLFILEMFKFLSCLFGYVEKCLDKKARANVKIYDITDWTGMEKLVPDPFVKN